MGLLKEIKDSLGRTLGRINGFHDGAEGKSQSFVMYKPFDENTAISQGYREGYEEGAKSSVPKTLNKVNKILDRFNEE